MTLERPVGFITTTEHDYHSLGITSKVIEELIAQRVAEALAAYEANHGVRLVVESQSQNGDDGDNRNGGGNRNGNGGGNGNKWMRQWE
nr:hypothetical protein [Tanacetum cinerariifolium]